MDEGLANNFSKRDQKKFNDFHCHLLLPLKLDKKSLKRVHIKFTGQKRGKSSSDIKRQYSP